MVNSGLSPTLKSIVSARVHQKRIVSRLIAKNAPPAPEWPDIPYRIEDLDIPEGLTQMEDGTEFLLFDTGLYYLLELNYHDTPLYYLQHTSDFY